MCWNPPDNSLKYHVCESDWGRLSALDMATLSGLVYENNCHYIDLFVNSTFHTSPKVLMERCNNTTFPVYVSFLVENHSRIVAFKGTSTVEDVYLDVALWATVRVMQFLSNLSPLSKVLPIDQVQWMVDKFRPSQLSQKETKMWNQMQLKMTEIQKLDKRKLVFTGHSLGGGFAQVMAARTGTSALVFSAPGMAFSATRFGVYRDVLETSGGFTDEIRGMQVTMRDITNVIPQFDVVPRVDMQAGLVQPIACRDSNGTFGEPVACHSILRSSCEIWRVCGDTRHRSMDRCNETVNITQLGKLGTKFFRRDDDMSV